MEGGGNNADVIQKLGQAEKIGGRIVVPIKLKRKVKKKSGSDDAGSRNAHGLIHERGLSEG